MRLPPFPYTESSANEWLDFLVKEKTEHPVNKRLRYATRRRSTDILVGDISLEELEDQEGTYKLGYWLAQEEWGEGEGVMTDVVKRLLGLACEAGISKIATAVKKENWSSRRVLEKSGFKVYR